MTWLLVKRETTMYVREQTVEPRDANNVRGSGLESESRHRDNKHGRAFCQVRFW